MKLKTILGQPSWRIATRDVEAFVTETGGQLAPVTFDRRGKKIAPFAVAPWATEKLGPSVPAILRVLRGDFLCVPFGGNARMHKGEKHPVHGEVANRRWTLESVVEAGGDAAIHLSMKTTVRKGRVDKFICLLDGHQAVYQQHVLTGMTGRMNLGHHAMLKFPGARGDEGTGLVATSKFVHGQVFPEPVEKPQNQGYSSLKPGAVFKSLGRVPTVFGDTTDLSRYPARRGFEDIVMLVAAQAPFAWTAVTFPAEKYVWFALKDPAVLRSTIFWISNGGRHYAPWNGRHVNVMGLEEVTTYFHGGLAEAAGRNPIEELGHPTTLTLSPKKPTVINYIMAVAPIPAGFDHVASITSEKDGRSVTLRSRSGKKTTAPLDVSFLHAGPLAE